MPSSNPDEGIFFGLAQGFPREVIFLFALHVRTHQVLVCLSHLRFPLQFLPLEQIHVLRQRHKLTAMVQNVYLRKHASQIKRLLFCTKIKNNMLPNNHKVFCL